MSEPAIWTARACVTDAAALGALLAPLPEDIAADARELATLAGRSKSGMRWSAQLRRAYYLQHDPAGVLSCITFNEVPSGKKAAELWAAIHENSAADLDSVCKLYAAVMGVELEKVVRH